MNGSLGESQRRILEHLKRRASCSIPDLAAELDLNVETVRTHLKALAAEGLVEREGTRRSGPGRPEILYGLTDGAERYFPRREGQVLQAFVRFLEESGDEDVVDRFYADYVEKRRAGALARVQGLKGEERLEEVARILTEDGFMAEIESNEGERPTLRVCHCPIRRLVDVTKAPCRAEIGFVRELLGERLARVGYIPSGDAACSYRITGNVSAAEDAGEPVTS